MFHYLSGTCQGMYGEYMILDVNGFGMKVMMPQSREKLPEKGREMQVYTSMVSSDAGVNLYGFFSLDELTLFELLTSKVPSVGPKGALSILSTLTPAELLTAVALGDAKAITRAKGIGTKTADRIVLELKDRIGQFEAAADVQVPETEAAKNQNMEVMDALLALGYSRQEFYAIANKLEADQTVDQQIRRALFLLSMK